MKNILYLVLITLFFSACEDEGTKDVRVPNIVYDNRLKINNNTDKSIDAFYNYSYPDTALPADSPVQNINFNKWFALPYQTLTLSRTSSWDSTFKKQIPSGKLNIFVLDDYTMLHTPWDTIVKKKLFVKRFSVTLDQLKAVSYQLKMK